MTVGTRTLPLTGSGDTTAEAAVDTIGGVDYPISKLAAGTEDSTALIGGDATNGLDVDVTRVVPGTGATNLGKAVDAVAGATDTGVVPLAIRDDSLTTITPADGDYTPLRTAFNGALWVQVVGIANAIMAAVSGDVDHDDPDTGYPVKVGFNARTTNPTAVADGDRVNGIADDVGRQVVAIGQVRDLIVQQATTITNSTTETTILTAGAAGVFHDLVSLDITNASPTAVVVTIRDDTGAGTAYSYALAANGGMVKVWTRPFKAGAAADNWTAQLSVNTVTVHFVVQAEKNV